MHRADVFEPGRSTELEKPEPPNRARPRPGGADLAFTAAFGNCLADKLVRIATDFDRLSEQYEADGLEEQAALWRDRAAWSRAQSLLRTHEPAALRTMWRAFETLEPFVRACRLQLDREFAERARRPENLSPGARVLVREMCRGALSRRPPAAIVRRLSRPRAVHAPRAGRIRGARSGARSDSSDDDCDCDPEPPFWAVERWREALRPPLNARRVALRRLRAALVAARLIPTGDPLEPHEPPLRGEDVARSLRTLRAAGPSTAAFAAKFGHLPADQQLVAFSTLEPAWEAACWADLSRAAPSDREVDRPQRALRGAGGRLRSLLIRARLAHPDDPLEPYEPPLGLWRLRVLRCRWLEWREGLRVWNWRERRWEVHDR